MTMPSSSTTAGSASYYRAGSTELAKETPVTLKKLETRRKLTGNASRLVIVLVGLPARGKSFVARKLQYYLTWSGVQCRIFNVGRYRREAAQQLDDDNDEDNEASDQATTTTTTTSSSAAGKCAADFFDAKNTRAAELREKVAAIALQDMLRWLDREEDNNNNTISAGEDSCSEDGHSASAAQHQAATAPLDSSTTTATPTPTATPNTSRHSAAFSLSSAGMASILWGSHNANLRVKRNERIAIFDATNSTAKRRQWVLEECTSPAKRPGKPTGVVFLESICNDEELISENLRFKAQNSPDYDGVDVEAALADLRMRVQKYEEQYETIADDSMSYIKMFNLSTKLLVNHIYGRMAKELVPALMAWHIGTRPVFLVRPGQTISGIVTDGEDYVVKRNKSELLGGEDPRFLDLSRSTRGRGLRGESLGATGRRFRAELLEHLYDEVHAFMLRRASVHDMAHTGTSLSGLAPRAQLQRRGESFDDRDHADTTNHENEENDDNDKEEFKHAFPLRILTSTMPRAVDTVDWSNDYDFGIHDMSNLNPLDKGDFAGMELQDIRTNHPEWFDKLLRDPFGTRFPGGECYRDLIRRLTSIVIDIEQQVIPTLVVSHVSILQCLMAYFRNAPVEECTSIEVPMHTVIKFTPVRGGGWSESQHLLLAPGEGEGEEIIETSCAPVASSSLSSAAAPLAVDTTTTSETAAAAAAAAAPPEVSSSLPPSYPLLQSQVPPIRAVESESEFSAISSQEGEAAAGIAADLSQHNAAKISNQQQRQGKDRQQFPIWDDSTATAPAAAVVSATTNNGEQQVESK